MKIYAFQNNTHCPACNTPLIPVSDTFVRATHTFMIRKCVVCKLEFKQRTCTEQNRIEKRNKIMAALFVAAASFPIIIWSLT